MLDFFYLISRTLLFYLMLFKLRRKRQRIRVLFLVSELSKWKSQFIYDLLEKSSDFEPVVAVTQLSSVHNGKDPTRDDLDKNYCFFKSKFMNAVKAYDNGHFLDLRAFSPDIVFYQQPWNLSKIQHPKAVSKFALTFYIPYYLNCYNVVTIDYNLEFHKYLFRYYVLNKEWESIYRKKMGNNVIGLGHPFLDYFSVEGNFDSKYVIYAPHYSFSHEKNINPVNYGTFLDYGFVILNYAKMHPEFKWLFKPHPQLKSSLYKIGWSFDKIEHYYQEWESIGLACYDFDYVDYFLNSRVLITDCSSFLMEYLCTKKPIIHLINCDCKIEPLENSKKIFDTFYKVHDKSDLLKYLDEILINNDDYLFDSRIKVLDECGFLGLNSSLNILNDLKSLLKR